jgi:hypothetical protein
MTTIGVFGTFDNYQCCQTCTPSGERGVTFWSYPTPTTIQPGGTMTLSFTPKKPGGFAGKNGCAVHFFSQVDSASNCCSNMVYPE